MRANLGNGLSVLLRYEWLNSTQLAGHDGSLVQGQNIPKVALDKGKG